MRIIYDHQIFCQQRYGGVSRYFYKLASELTKANYNIQVVAPIHKNYYIENLPGSAVWSLGALKKYPPKTGRPLFLPLNRLIAKQIIKKKQGDIIHETYYSQYRSGSKATPTVITVYDMIHELFPECFPQNDSTTRIKKIAVERADHIICISESTRADLIRLFGTREDKVSCIHLGFENISSQDSEVRTHSHGKRPFLFYVGSRIGYKNFDSFLKAVAASPNLIEDFDIIAFGGGRLTSTEKALIRKLGYREDQIQQISGDDILLASFYERARALIYPSLYEGFGLPPLEAMTYQCPVISSNTSSMPEVIGNAAEFFDPNNIEDMTESIERVVYSDKRISELIALGQKRLQYFSWESCAKQTLAIYEKLV